MADNLDTLLHQWAAWVENGRLMPAKQQVTHFLNAGSRGNYGPRSPDVSLCIESDIESAVCALAVKQPVQAKVIRAEYSRRFASYRQLDRAVALELSLRTYQRHLQSAKKFIQERI